jgi:hypothetical protein
MTKTADIQAWRQVPKWLYWLAAPLAPAFIALGAVLCVGLSLALGQEPRLPRKPRHGGWPRHD